MAPLSAFGGDPGLLTALVVGLAFGFFLERGGMGDARKLAAQFYLRDLAVFKVLFTGVVTAMVGVYWLGRAGVLAPELLAVPETFVPSQIAGGLVFGVGFVVAGLCPGTSCVAAASGRLDGLAVMAGMLGGVLVFGALHPLVEPFHLAGGKGVLTLPGLLGTPPGVVVAGVAILALAGFRLAEAVESRATAREASPR